MKHREITTPDLSPEAGASHSAINRTIAAILAVGVMGTASAQEGPHTPIDLKKVLDGQIGLTGEEIKGLHAIADDPDIYRYDPDLEVFLSSVEREVASAIILSDAQGGGPKQDTIYDAYSKVLQGLHHAPIQKEDMWNTLLSVNEMERVLQTWANSYVTLQTRKEREQSFRDMALVLGRIDYEINYGSNPDNLPDRHGTKSINTFSNVANTVIDKAETSVKEPYTLRLGEDDKTTTDPRDIMNKIRNTVDNGDAARFYIAHAVRRVLDMIDSGGDLESLHQSLIQLARTISHAGDIAEGDRVALIRKLQGYMSTISSGDEKTYILNLLNDLVQLNPLGDQNTDLDGTSHHDVVMSIQKANLTQDYTYVSAMGSLRSLDKQSQGLVDHLAKTKLDTIDFSGLQSVDAKLWSDAIDAITANSAITTIVINPTRLLAHAQSLDLRDAPNQMERFLRPLSEFLSQRNGKKLVIKGAFDGMGRSYHKVGNTGREFIPLYQKGDLPYISPLVGDAHRKSTIIYDTRTLIPQELDVLADYPGNLELPLLIRRPLNPHSTYAWFKRWGTQHKRSHAHLTLGMGSISNEQLLSIVRGLTDARVRDMTIYLPHVTSTSELGSIVAKLDGISVVFGGDSAK